MFLRVENDKLGTGEVKQLDDDEIKFWNDLLSNYLKPLDEDKKKQKELAEGLKVKKYFNNDMATAYLILMYISIFLGIKEYMGLYRHCD